MVESWFLYAIGSFFLVWIYWFLQKVEAESSLNTNSFIFYAHSGCIIFPLIYIVFLWWTFDFNYRNILFWIGINLLYVWALKSRIKSLKTLSSSAFFINYRIASSSLLIILGQMFFHEHIALKEYVWMLLWFIIFYLLLEKKKTDAKKKEILYWYLFLLVSILLITIIWLLMKQFVIMSWWDAITYIFTAWIAGIFWTLLMKWWDSLSDVLVIKERKHVLFLAFTTFVFTSWIFANMNAIVQWWDLAIVYKILSYSLFIPIILSVIFYKEKIWIRQILAFILTVISIMLFV